jgi:hypothetical protein
MTWELEQTKEDVPPLQKKQTVMARRSELVRMSGVTEEPTREQVQWP